MNAGVGGGSPHKSMRVTPGNHSDLEISSSGDVISSSIQSGSGHDVNKSVGNTDRDIEMKGASAGFTLRSIVPGSESRIRGNSRRSIIM